VNVTDNIITLDYWITIMPGSRFVPDYLDFFVAIGGVAGGSDYGDYDGWSDLPAFDLSGLSPTSLGIGLQLGAPDVGLTFQLFGESALADLLALSVGGKSTELVVEGRTRAKTLENEVVYRLVANGVNITQVGNGSDGIITVAVTFDQIAVTTTGYDKGFTHATVESFGWDFTTQTSIDPDSLTTPRVSAGGQNRADLKYYMHLEGFAGNSAAPGFEGAFELNAYSLDTLGADLSATSFTPASFSNLGITFADDAARSELMGYHHRMQRYHGLYAPLTLKNVTFVGF
jgi:hypothetical protein